MVWLLFGLVGLGLWLVHDSLLPARQKPPRRPSPTLARLRDWLVQTGVPIDVGTFVLISFGGASLGGVLAHAVFGWPLTDALGIAVGGALYPVVLRGRRARRRQAVLRSLPEAIDRLRDSLASRIPIDVALGRLGTEAGPQALRLGFRQLSNELALGVAFGEAVQHWADGLADRTAERTCSALILYDEVGPARFGQCLDQLASDLRSDLALRDQVASARARIVFQARILMLLPVLVLLGLRTSQPIATQAFGTLSGQLVLAGGVLMLPAGYGLMLWLARLPSEEREVAR